MNFKITVKKKIFGQIVKSKNYINKLKIISEQKNNNDQENQDNQDFVNYKKSMDQSSLKNKLPNFNNNSKPYNNEENEEENQHFSYNPKFQNQDNNKAISMNYGRNSYEFSNNSSVVKNRNSQEEKKDISNIGNSESFYRNDSQKRGTFGVNNNEMSGLGAYEKSKIQNEQPNESINYDNKSSKKELRYLQETQSSRNLKRVFSGLMEKNIQTPKKSIEEIEEEQKKKRNAAEKCFSLYEGGKIKNEVNRLLAEKNQKIKEEMELKECTFMPKTNFNDRFNGGDKNVNNQMLKKLESNFYDRIISWQQKREKK